MSFTSLQPSHGSGSGGVRYLLRELERDAIGREVQRALDSLLGRDGARPELAEADRADEFIEWLGSDDSPLLLENVSQFVLDPEEHLRSLAERVEGTSRAAERVGAELTGAARPADAARQAAEATLRLLTFAELDAERVRGAPRRRGTPRGETRLSYLGLFSPPRDLSNREIKRIVSGVIGPRWPGAVAIGYVHRDTDNVHLHLWLSAETTSGRKIDVRRLTPSGDPVLDKYPDLDEQVALALSRHFGDPSIVETHLAKKLEWVYWREQFDAAIARGERPPVMPYRARHDFDLIGEAKALAGRERGDGRRREAGAGKAAPVPRANSLAGALELWGKVVHLEARVGYRRELLATLDAWRGECGEPANDVRRYFERRLEEAERDCARHKDAFEKTLANRAREGYPELRHPLHNGKQIAEMEQIARLTRDPELLRHVRAYTAPGRPDDAEGRAREIATLWRDHVEARLEARERAETLARAAGLSGGANERGLTGVAPGGRGERLDHDRVIVGGWVGGGWTPGQMRSSLSCLESEGVRAHGRRYVHALEYLAATGEALAEGRAVGPTRALKLSLEESDLARIDRLVREEAARVGADERALLADLASLARAGTEAEPGEARRLFEATLEADRFRNGGINRARPSLGGQGEFRPHDDQWVGRLAADLTLKETEALALAAGGAARSRFDAAREEAGVLRRLLELSREVRSAAGVTPDAPAAAFDAAQERALDGYRRVVGEALRSRGAGWTEWQAEGVAEFRHVLPGRERETAGHIVEEARARIEEEWRAAALFRLEPQLASAADRYLLAAYQDEGLEGLRQPLRRRGHVAALIDQFSRLARDSEYDPQRVGAAALEVRAERAVSEGIGRVAREEREAAELGRLEARMILACAERDAAAAEMQRFYDHDYFLRWNYRTGDGKTSQSLCEVRLSLHEEKDPVLLSIAEDAERHIVRSINNARAEFAERVAALAVEAHDATAAYEARAQELTRLRLATPVPVFEPGELGRLEKAAFAARNPHQIAIVARCEGERYGAEYAAARAQGRVLRAAAEQGKERGAPEWYERPVAAARLDRLRGPAREPLSEALGRHLEARDAERDAAASFRGGLQAQADVRAAHAPRTPDGHVKPLITESEARQVCERWASSKGPARRSWEEMTKNAEVAVEIEGPHRGGVITYQEWWSQNSFRVTPARHFEKRIEDATVMSRAGAKEKLRQQAKERGGEYRAPRR